MIQYATYGKYTFIIIVIIIISNKFFIKQYTYYNNKSILINNTRSLVLCVGFVDRCLSFCPFSFGHCIVCRFMDSDCPFGIFKLFLHNNILFSTIKTHTFWCFWWSYYTTVSRGGVFLYVHTPPPPIWKPRRNIYIKSRFLVELWLNFWILTPSPITMSHEFYQSWLQALDIHLMLPFNFWVNFHL
jgi:hypothetical protein